MKKESNLRPSILHRLPPLHYIVLVAVFIGFGAWYVVKSLDESRQEAAEGQVNYELESRRVAEIRAIRARLRGADPKHEQTCANAADFRYAEESAGELARMRRIENCVNQMAKLGAH